MANKYMNRYTNTNKMQIKMSHLRLAKIRNLTQDAGQDVEEWEPQTLLMEVQTRRAILESVLAELHGIEHETTL